MRTMKFWTTVATPALALAMATGLSAQSELGEKLQVHGYMTQGFAAATDQPTWGIGKSGTFEYRMAAVQFRYAITDDQAVVVQLNSRKLGDYVTTQGDASARLEWAFYQANLRGNRIRFGRIPVQWGLSNEVRDVGTLLPFFRAPASVYWDQVEILNGGSVDHTLKLGGWSADASGSLGTLEYKTALTTDPSGPEVFVGTLRSTGGLQLMLNTPVQGVRVGTLVRAWRKDPVAGRFPITRTPYMTVLSAEAALPWIQLRGESLYMYQQVVNLGGSYIQASVPLGHGLSLNAQHETSWQDYNLEGNIVGRWDGMKDNAASLKYDVSSNLSLKLEAHQTRGWAYDTWVDMAGPPADGKYFIASVAASF